MQPTSPTRAPDPDPAGAFQALANELIDGFAPRGEVEFVSEFAEPYGKSFGLHIPAGGIVQVIFNAAGTDPSAMPGPSFDITQTRPPHLGFGAGVHHCLGHFVARTDMAVALPLLAARMPDARPDGPGTWLTMSGNTGPVTFPIRSSAQL